MLGALLILIVKLFPWALVMMISLICGLVTYYTLNIYSKTWINKEMNKYCEV